MRRLAGIISLILCTFSTGCRTGSKNESSVLEIEAAPTYDDQVYAEQIKNMVIDYYKATDAAKLETRKKFYELTDGLQKSARLKNTLRVLLSTAGKVKKNKTFQQMAPDDREDLVTQLAAAIGAESLFRKEGSGYRSWNIVSSEMLTQVATTNFQPGGPGTPSALRNDDFISELSELTKTTFHDYRNSKILVDGPASFKERERLIDGAKKRIWVSSWAFYDDETGVAYAAKLVKAAKRGIDVRIMVDGLVANRKFADQTSKSLQKAGVQLMPWVHRDKKFFGMHRKMLLVDSKAMIIGGMNFGDVNSHRGSINPLQQSRDTDLYAEGHIVLQAEKVFATAWNLGISVLPVVGRLKPIMGAGGAPAKSTGSRMAILDHEPSNNAGDAIYLATLKAIQGASERIYIENAYYIATPAVELALVEAARRGVKVVVLTNSSESVDEATLIRPIYRGLPKLVNAGVEVYLFKGATLQSKFMVVDRSFGWIGSYSLHPRSFRMESEVVAAFADPKLGRSMSEVFEADIKLAQKVTRVDQVQIPQVFVSDLAEAFFFDQL